MAIEDESTIDPTFAPKRTPQRPRHADAKDFYDDPANRYNVARQGPWKVTSSKSSHVDAELAPASREAPRKTNDEPRCQPPIPRELIQKLRREARERQAAEDEAAHRANAEFVAEPRGRRSDERSVSREGAPEPRTVTMPKHMTDKVVNGNSKGKAPAPAANQEVKPKEKLIIRGKDGREKVVDMPARFRQSGPDPRASRGQEKKPVELEMETAKGSTTTQEQPQKKREKASDKREQVPKQETALPAEGAKGLAKKEKKQQQKRAKREAAANKKLQDGEKVEEKPCEEPLTMYGAAGHSQRFVPGQWEIPENPPEPSSRRSNKTEEHNFAGFGEAWNMPEMHGCSSKKSGGPRRTTSNAGSKPPPKPVSGWGILKDIAKSSFGLPVALNDQAWETGSKHSKKSRATLVAHEHRDFAARPGSIANAKPGSLHASAIERALHQSRPTSSARKTVFAGHGWISPHPLSEAPTRFRSPPQSAVRGPNVNMSYEEFLVAKDGTPRHSEVGTQVAGGLRGGASKRDESSLTRVVSGSANTYRSATVETERGSKASRRTAATIEEPAQGWDMLGGWDENIDQRDSRVSNKRTAQTWGQGGATGSWNIVPQLDGNRSFESISTKSEVSETSTEDTHTRVEHARRYIIAEAARMDKEQEVGNGGRKRKASKEFLPTMMLTIGKILLPKKQQHKRIKRFRTDSVHDTPASSINGLRLHRRTSSSIVSTTAITGGYTKSCACSRQSCEKTKILMTSFDRMQEYNKEKEIADKRCELRNVEVSPTPGPRKYVRKERSPPMLTHETSFGSNESGDTVEDPMPTFSSSSNSDDTVEDLLPTQCDVEEFKRKLEVKSTPEAVHTSTDSYDYTIPAGSVRAGSTLTPSHSTLNRYHQRGEREPEYYGEGEEHEYDNQSVNITGGFVFPDSLHDSDLHETDYRPGRYNPAYDMEGFRQRTYDEFMPMSPVAPTTVVPTEVRWDRLYGKHGDPWMISFEQHARNAKKREEEDERIAAAQATAAAAAEREREKRDHEAEVLAEYNRTVTAQEAVAAAYVEDKEHAGCRPGTARDRQPGCADEGCSRSPLFPDNYGNQLDAQGNFLRRVDEQYEQPSQRGYDRYGEHNRQQQHIDHRGDGGLAQGDTYRSRKDDCTEHNDWERQSAYDGPYGALGSAGGFAQGNMYKAKKGHRESKNDWERQSEYDGPYAGRGNGGGFAQRNMYVVKNKDCDDDQSGFHGCSFRYEKYEQRHNDAYYGYDSQRR